VAVLDLSPNGAQVLSMSVPMTTTALDEIRTSMAARYLEGRIMNAR